VFTNAVGRLRVFLTRPPPIRKSPARPPATAFNLPPNFTPQASDQARYMRERHDTAVERPRPGANICLSYMIARLQPPGDDRRLQQKVALTPRRTTTSTTSFNFDVHKRTTTSTAPGTAVSSLRSFLNSLLHPAAASRALQFTYSPSYTS
jgi:hypothetical protein